MSHFDPPVSLQNIDLYLQHFEKENVEFHDFHDQIKRTLNSQNVCYRTVQNILSSRLISKNLKIKTQSCNFASYAVWVRKLSHFEGGT
jgi:hypothetical protein